MCVGRGALIAGKQCTAETCKFFYTRSDSTPDEFFGLFQAAMMIREARLCELATEIANYELTFPFWAIEAYKAAERAFRIVEAEHAANPKGSTGADMTITKTRSKVFADIENEKASRELKAINHGVDLADVDKAFEFDPTLESSIHDFFRSQL